MKQLFSKKFIPIFVAALIMLAGGGCDGRCGQDGKRQSVHCAPP